MPDGSRYDTVDNSRPFVEAVYDPLPPTIDEQKTNLLSSLATKRYDVEVGGFDYLGKRVLSDRESQSKIQGLMVGIQLLGDAFSTSWKCKDGEWLMLDKNTALGMIGAALTHVSTLYVREGVLADQIKNATTQEELDTLSSLVQNFA